VPCSTALVHVGISDVVNGWILIWDPVTNKIERGGSVIFNEDELPCHCHCQDPSELTSVLNSIRVERLSDSSIIKEFEIQDACVDLVVSVAPFLSDAPDTYKKAIKSEWRLEWLKACEEEIYMMVSLWVW
jgi:hypothetical protein